MAEQVTEMVIKVDLQCHRCYKKIKKILCEIPEVKDQIFDMKQNAVKIKVVCCCPEKIRQKICCKGRDIILAIDIILPKPPPKEESPPESPKKEPPPPPPVLGYPLVRAVGLVYVCPPCHNRGCGGFCSCHCHRGKRPMCADGCGRLASECQCRRPPMCHDGCGRPASECQCRRPSMCLDGCGKPASECRCRRPLMCLDGCGRPASECQCRRPSMCHDGCGMPASECRCRRPLMCHDGCGRPATECRCRRPRYSRCCDRCSDETAPPSCTPHSCDCGWPPVCATAGHECETSCSPM